MEMVWGPIYFLIFILGLCVGSFLNVLIYRLPHLLPITGWSFCPKCKKKISWRDNIPLLSYILLRGRCRGCFSPISLQYPLVELASGLLTVFVYHVLIYDIWKLIWFLLISYALLVVFVSDLRYQIIPDQIVYPVIGINLVRQISLINQGGGFLLSGLGAGLFFFLLHLVTRKKGMGMGDVKLAILMGLVLGFPKIILALYLSFLTGAFIGVILVLAKFKRFGEHIPFGPFLSSATFISLFWGDEILKWFTARFF